MFENFYQNKVENKNLKELQYFFFSVYSTKKLLQTHSIDAVQGRAKSSKRAPPPELNFDPFCTRRGTNVVCGERSRCSFGEKWQTLHAPVSRTP